MIQIAEVKLDQALSHGLEALAFDHWSESSPFRADLPFLPDWSYYRGLERGGAFKLIGVFEETSVLVGYASFFIFPDAWTHHRQATEDAIYLDPAHRGMAGFRLLRHIEGWLKGLNVRIVRYNPPTHSALCDLLPKLGYKHVENGYAKVT